MVYTTEQLQVIYNDHEGDVFVDSRAGTGKTTVLKEYSSENFSKPILLLVFNNTVRKVAKMTMPINVENHTVNSFAYKYFENGRLLEKVAGEKILISDYISSHFVATRYLNNIKNGPQALSLANTIAKAFNDKLDFNRPVISHDQRVRDIVALIESDMHNKKIPLTHNFILRQFSDNFDFSSFEYEVIIVDEAQDVNAVMLEIIHKINARCRIYVGDPLQSIYGFRGNLNIFEDQFSKDGVRLNLTGSFRMGHVIAEFIRKSTSMSYQSEIQFEGLNEYEGEVVNKDDFEGFDREAEQLVCINRTNAGLFDQAFQYASEGYNVAIPFEWEKIKELIESVFYLRMGMIDAIESPHIRMYGSFEAFEEAIKNNTDIELRFLLKIIKKHGLKTLDNVSILETRLSSNRFAEIICVTAHKAKGLEFENVLLAEDFAKYKVETKPEERNLVYVAMTRASKRLILNEDLTKINRSLTT